MICGQINLLFKTMSDLEDDTLYICPVHIYVKLATSKATIIRALSISLSQNMLDC